MSVLGVGLDLVDVESFARQLTVAGSTFAESTFTPSELLAADDVAAGATTPAAPDRAPALARARHLAARFAAKEAFIKAWSMARVGRPPAMAAIRFRELEVVADTWGRPVLYTAGATAEAVAASLGDVAVTLSLTHDGPMAAAVVVLSVPADAAPAHAAAVHPPTAAAHQPTAGAHEPAGRS